VAGRLQSPLHAVWVDLRRLAVSARALPAPLAEHRVQRRLRGLGLDILLDGDAEPEQCPGAQAGLKYRGQHLLPGGAGLPRHRVLRGCRLDLLREGRGLGGLHGVLHAGHPPLRPAGVSNAVVVQRRRHWRCRLILAAHTSAKPIGRGEPLQEGQWCGGMGRVVHMPRRPALQRGRQQ